jgi:cell division protein FtsA
MKTVAAAIEFGTSKIITLIAESGGFTRCEIIGSGTVPYSGYCDGNWNDREELLSAIEASVHAAEVEAKRRIHEIYVGVPGDNINVVTAIGETEILSEDGRVGDDDITRVMDAAADQLDLANNGGHVLHRSPAWFSVDGGKRTMSPINAKGKVLTALVSFIQADEQFVNDTRTLLADLDIEVKAYMAPALGSALLLLSFDERDRKPVLVDVGYLNTEISVIEGDAITYHTTVPRGGGDITAELAKSLETTMNEAETVKRNYIFTPDEFEEQSDPQVELEDGSVVAFPRKFVSEVIEQETDQIIDYIKEKLDYAEELITPKSQIFVTGGGLVNMRGSREYLSEKLGRPVKIPMVKAARLNNPRYSNALGLMDQVFDAVEQQAYNASSQGGALNGLKNIFKR